MKPTKHKFNHPTPYSIVLQIGHTTEHLPIIIRKHPRSRSMVIRYQPIAHILALTLPRYTPIRQGLHFIEQKRNWIIDQIKESSARVPFTHGQLIPILGKTYEICHTQGRGVVEIKDERIVVPGEESFLRRRLTDWLKRTAKSEITKLAEIKAREIGVVIKKISMRDTISHWGSCSHKGNLSFSWRLVFAPIEVLDYLVCHEVAHIKHHNHSENFWKTVALLCPDYKKSCDWLQKNGSTLYYYG